MSSSPLDTVAQLSPKTLQHLDEVATLAQVLLVALDQAPPQLRIAPRPGRVALAAMVCAAVAMRRAKLTLSEAGALWRLARKVAEDLTPLEKAAVLRPLS